MEPRLTKADAKRTVNALGYASVPAAVYALSDTGLKTAEVAERLGMHGRTVRYHLEKRRREGVRPMRCNGCPCKREAECRERVRRYQPTLYEGKA